MLFGVWITFDKSKRGF